jgi:hypothetical protein
MTYEKTTYYCGSQEGEIRDANYGKEALLRLFFTRTHTSYFLRIANWKCYLDKSLLGNGGRIREVVDWI